MAYEDNAQLLTDYTQWVALKKIQSTDVSPEAYLIEKAQDGAYDRVVKAIGFINGTTWEEKDWPLIEKLLAILEE